MLLTTDSVSPQRVILVSNRLPVTVITDGSSVQVEASTGGLATGLAAPHERRGGLWVGWPGPMEGLATEARTRVEGELAERHLVPVNLTEEEVRRYYEGYANGVLWPLFHYLLESVPLVSDDWDAYRQVNERFAEVVADQIRDGDLVWVHDYQLMLVPALLRERRPRARIGFFLHIPFPTPELFRTLPARGALLEGLLGADLIGFHTADYLRHFSSSVLRVLGQASDVDRLQWRGREVRLGVFPMGIDARSFAELGNDPTVQAEAKELHTGDGIQTLVGIDRLDYTKGIPRRLLAFERLLAGHPELHGRVRLVQVAVPSREKVEAYERFRQNVDRLVGRINGAFATPRWVPVHYMYRGIAKREVVALYRLADVMVVTPVRDGMNLVAKEFAAARTDGDGVLVLSEFAGAACELAEALHVNPFDIDQAAETMLRALTMPERERRVRMAGLRRRVFAYDAERWCNAFLTTLGEPASSPGLGGGGPSPPDLLEEALTRARRAGRLLLLLDYDGTLVDFQKTPDLAAPDARLLSLLQGLAARKGTEVHLVSGRARATLEAWFGDLPLGLHAEHGACSRALGEKVWTELDLPSAAWIERVRVILEQFTALTPGSLVEEKGRGLAWHHRAADPEFGQRQANMLRVYLTQMLSNLPVEILSGSYVVEVRPHGVHKGRVVANLTAHLQADALVCAFGDDRTDEDMFAALPAGSVSVHIGPEPSAATLRLATAAAARAWLARLLPGPRPAA